MQCASPDLADVFEVTRGDHVLVVSDTHWTFITTMREIDARQRHNRGSAAVVNGAHAGEWAAEHKGPAFNVVVLLDGYKADPVRPVLAPGCVVVEWVDGDWQVSNLPADPPVKFSPMEPVAQAPTTPKVRIVNESGHEYNMSFQWRQELRRTAEAKLPDLIAVGVAILGFFDAHGQSDRDVQTEIRPGELRIIVPGKVAHAMNEREAESRRPAGVTREVWNRTPGKLGRERFPDIWPADKVEPPKPELRPWRVMMEERATWEARQFTGMPLTSELRLALRDNVFSGLWAVAQQFGVELAFSDVEFARDEQGVIYHVDICLGVAKRLDEAQALLERTKKPGQPEGLSRATYQAARVDDIPCKDKPVPYTNHTFANVDRNDKAAFTKALVSLIEDGPMMHSGSRYVFWMSYERFRLTPKAMTPQVEVVLSFGDTLDDIKLAGAFVDGEAIEFTPELQAAKLNKNLARWCEGWRHDGLLCALMLVANGRSVYTMNQVAHLLTQMPPDYKPRPDVADLIATLQATHDSLVRERAVAETMAALRDDFDNLPDAEPCGIIPRP